MTVLTTAVATIGAASAAVAAVPALTADPNVGLVDGQTVTVTSTGLIAATGPPGTGTFVPSLFECAPVFPASAVFDVNTAINVVAPLITQNCVGFGTFPLTETALTSRTVDVRRSFTSDGGVFVQCGLAPGDCLLLAVGIVSALPAPALSSVPISFAPLTPQSPNDCKNGGWRHVADDAAQAFQNQGRCVSWAVHHRR